MKKACLFVRNDPAMLANNIFLGTEIYGMKSDGFMFRHLRELLAQMDIELNTQDITPPAEAYFVIYLDQVEKEVVTEKSFLIVTEPPIYSPDAWVPENHVRFRKVFMHDGQYEKNNPALYRQINYAIDFEGMQELPVPEEEAYAKRRLACLINGSISKDKAQKEKNSLLWERYYIITWFSRFHSQEFDFFGRGIRKKLYGMSFRGLGLLKKILPAAVIEKLAMLVQHKVYRVYKGEIDALKKNETLANYKFNFCLENSTDIDGYVTEKLFDCFYTKTVPVYQGAPNVGELVPEECFVRYERFGSLDELYDYMKAMPYKEARKIFEAQHHFLGSEKARHLSTENYCLTILSELKKASFIN